MTNEIDMRSNSREMDVSIAAGNSTGLMLSTIKLTVQCKEMDRATRIQESEATGSCASNKKIPVQMMMHPLNLS